MKQTPHELVGKVLSSSGKYPPMAGPCSKRRPWFHLARAIAQTAFLRSLLLPRGLNLYPLFPGVSHLNPLFKFVSDIVHRVSESSLLSFVNVKVLSHSHQANPRDCSRPLGEIIWFLPPLVSVFHIKGHAHEFGK